MFGYILRRLLATIPVMGVVAVVTFLLIRLAPGDPAVIMIGDSATPQQLAEMRERMGLNQSFVVQFLLWIGDMLRGQLGVSLQSNVSVASLIGARLAPTLWLALATMSFSILVAVPLGVLAAWARGTLLDRAVMTVAVLGFSTPVFVTGYVLAYFFSLKMGWFPVQGYNPPEAGFIDFFTTISLPALTLSTIYIALIARIARSSVLEVMGEDYIRTARAKGAKERTVFLRHALRNAAVPIITVIGSGAAFLISGVVVTESVFNIPGLGRLVVESVLARDYPTIQALILLFALIYVLINLAVDVLYTVFDPRIRY